MRLDGGGVTGAPRRCDRLDLRLLGIRRLDALPQHQVLRPRAQPVEEVDLLRGGFERHDPLARLARRILEVLVDAERRDRSRSAAAPSVCIVSDTIHGFIC